MRLFFRRRAFNEKELRLIEKIEKRIEGLIKEWDESYKGKEFLYEWEFEKFIRGVKRWADHLGHFHIVENEPGIGWGVFKKEKKVYRKLWKSTIKIYKKINSLTKVSQEKIVFGSL